MSFAIKSMLRGILARLTMLNEVNDHLYIGSFRGITDESLQQHGITCVVNCSNINPHYEIGHIKYIPVTLEDNEGENISRFFNEITSAIEEERKAHGKTAVYCIAGISRSASFCLAYLMKYQDMTLRTAFKHLQSRRRIIRPNNGFFKQLIEFERSLYGQNTVQMVPVPTADSPDYLVPDVFYEVCPGMVWLESLKKKIKGK